MESVVYFFQRFDSAIKIGFTSKSVLGRMKSLQVKFGKLELLGVIDGDTKLETNLHKRFAPAKVQDSGASGREWFHPVPELLSYIKTNARSYELEAQDRERISLSAQLIKGHDDDLIEWINGYGTGQRQGAVIAAIRLGLGFDPHPEPVSMKLQRQFVAIEAEHKAIQKTMRDAVLQMERRYQQAMKARGLPITEVSPYILQIRAENIRNAPW